MIPCYECFSKDGKIDYGEFRPCSWPCRDCGSRVYKTCERVGCKSPDQQEDCEFLKGKNFNDYYSKGYSRFGVLLSFTGR